jgi:hypothetical protein
MTIASFRAMCTNRRANAHLWVLECESSAYGILTFTWFSISCMHARDLFTFTLWSVSQKNFPRTHTMMPSVFVCEEFHTQFRRQIFRSFVSAHHIAWKAKPKFRDEIKVRFISSQIFDTHKHSSSCLTVLLIIFLNWRNT